MRAGICRWPDDTTKFRPWCTGKIWQNERRNGIKRAEGYHGEDKNNGYMK